MKKVKASEVRGGKRFCRDEDMRQWFVMIADPPRFDENIWPVRPAGSVWVVNHEGYIVSIPATEDVWLIA